MEEIQTKSGKILCVEIPEDTVWWEIMENNLGRFITETLNLNQQFLKYGKSSVIFDKEVKNIVYYNPDSFHLPKGRWEIVEKLSELTDKDCEEFCFKHPATLNYFNYRYHRHSEGIFSIHYELTAKESFISLLQSEGIDTNKEHLILKIL